MGLLPLLPVAATVLIGPNCIRPLLAAVGAKEMTLLAALWRFVRQWWRVYGWSLLVAAVVMNLLWSPFFYRVYTTRNDEQPYALSNPSNSGRGDRDVVDYMTEVWPALEDYLTEDFTVAVACLAVMLMSLGTTRRRNQGILIVLWLALMSVPTALGATIPSIRYFMVMGGPAGGDCWGWGGGDWRVCRPCAGCWCQLRWCCWGHMCNHMRSRFLKPPPMTRTTLPFVARTGSIFKLGSCRPTIPHGV